jgi:hypothetical protein
MAVCFSPYPNSFSPPARPDWRHSCDINTLNGRTESRPEGTSLGNYIIDRTLTGGNKIERKTKQWCPLSPLLFVLCVKTIKTSTSQSSLKYWDQNNDDHWNGQAVSNFHMENGIKRKTTTIASFPSLGARTSRSEICLHPAISSRATDDCGILLTFTTRSEHLSRHSPWPLLAKFLLL